jgi:hypothetical protein
VKRYGIRKRSRAGTTHSYTGPSWQAAGFTTVQDSFRSKASANFVARKLSEVNPVGFEVFELEDHVKCHKCPETAPKSQAMDLDWGKQYLPPDVTRWFCPRHT